MNLRRITQLWQYFLLRLTQELVFMCPHKWLLAIGKQLGGLAHLLAIRRRRLVVQQLQQTQKYCPTVSWDSHKLSRNIFHNLGITVLEILALKRFQKQWAHKVDIDLSALQVLQELNENTGVILSIAHFNNWEMLVFVAQQLRKDVLVVTQKIKNPYVNTWITKQRQALGLRVHPKKGFLKVALKTLRQGGVVACLVDQRAARGSTEMPFLGRSARTYLTPAVLSHKTQCPIVSLFDWRDCNTGEHHLEIQEPLWPQEGIDAIQNKSVGFQGQEALQLLGPAPPAAVLATMQLLTSHLEERILRDPSAWLWLHNRWKGAQKQ